jgi:hypothetical protein
MHINGGWFNGAEAVPDLPRDQGAVTEDGRSAYTSALEHNGFFGPNSYDMNHEANARFRQEAVNEGYPDMSTLSVVRSC